MKIAIIGFLFLAQPVFGNSVFIAQTAQGGDTGADCNDAVAATYFNTSANWTSGTPTGIQIGPGTVVHLCGSLTSALSAQGSGSSGNVIEILFESGANITLPTCNTVCMNLSSYSYILVDGGANTPCGWNVATNSVEATCNGYIEDTANGQGLTYNNGDVGIFTSGSNIEIRNLGIYDMYVANGNVSGPANDPACVETEATGTVNLLIHDITCHDAQIGVENAHEASSSSYNIYNNYMYNINGGFTGIMDGTTSNVNFYGNWIGDMSEWAPYTTYHHDGIYVFCDAFTTGCATLSSWNVYNNVFAGSWGNEITSAWYVDNTEGMQGINFFNNVFAMTDAFIGGSGFTALYPGTTDTYSEYNNTYLSNASSTIGCAETGENGSSLTIAFENNLFQDCDAYVVSYSATWSPINYNVYATCTGSGGDCWEYNGSFVSWTTWKSDVSGEANSYFYTSTLAGLNSNYIPTTGSVAIGAGTNLTSVCSGQSNPGLGALCFDAAGNARPSSGAWTAGAYNAASTGGASTLSGVKISGAKIP